MNRSSVARRRLNTEPTPKTNKNDKRVVRHDEMPSHTLVPTAFSVGALAGFVGSLAGMGGGFVMIPLMTSSLLRVSQHAAHGTSLFAVCATGLAGALGYGLQDIYVDSAVALALTGMATARYGALATSRFSATTLRTGFGIFMVVAAPVVPLKTYVTARYGNKKVGDNNGDAADGSSAAFVERILVPSVIGLASGFMAGLFGVGGGIVSVPALTVATDMTHHQALGTSLCAMALPAMVGTVTHFQKGNVAMRIAVPLACGAFTGGYIGGRSGSQIQEDKLRWGFSALLLTLGTRNLLKIAQMKK